MQGWADESGGVNVDQRSARIRAICFARWIGTSASELLISSPLVGEDQGGGASASTRSMVFASGSLAEDPPP